MLARHHPHKRYCAVFTAYRAPRNHTMTLSMTRLAKRAMFLPKCIP